ncbi:VOC family protein [Streptomyces sp. NPDC059695]|uniref:VOC family protein n=1 Tax=Streptomyces sp. NPDC059695 TaxID=3346910 RepID=UPI003686F5C9
MTLRPVKVTIDALDDSAVGRFWAEALGRRDPAGFGVGVVAVREPGPRPAVKNRVHLDLATASTAHQAELVARLRSLGATPVDIGQGDVPWTVLADPEGNEFCVLEPREVYRDTGPIAAVVVDCADPRAMARFWDEALDWTLHEVADDRAVLRSAEGAGPYLEFLLGPDAKTVPDRVRVDLLCQPGDDREAEATRLRALGATDLDGGRRDVPWTCMSDPEGHDFRILAPRA